MHSVFRIYDTRIYFNITAFKVCSRIYHQKVRENNEGLEFVGVCKLLLCVDYVNLLSEKKCNNRKKLY